jgi:hypothetical protein
VVAARAISTAFSVLRPELDDFAMNMEQKMSGFNQMVQQPTHLIVRSEFSEKCFLGKLSPCVAAAFARFDPVRFFLWGYLKAQAYQHRTQTFEGLKEAITQEVAAIPPEMTRRLMEKYRERLNQCIDNEGRHLSDVVFNFKTALYMLSSFKKIPFLVWFLLASLIGEFFLPHHVYIHTCTRIYS